MTPLERLQRQPTRFSIDQAAAVLAPALDPNVIAFRTVPRLGAPGGEVTQVRVESRELASPTFGLTGAGGVLPRHYTAWVDNESRKRSMALQDFVDLLSRRFTGLFVQAGARHRPTRDPQPAAQVLAAAIGLGTPRLDASLQTPLDALLYHAGGLSSRSRSAERLRGMLSEETGSDVRIVEFEGGWTRLPLDEQTRLQAPGVAGRHARLGVDAAAGLQLWDPAARFVVRLGPLPLSRFRALLPGTTLHRRLVELTRLHVGLEQAFALNPVLAAHEVPALCLSASGSAQLGWTSWLTAPRPRRAPAADALLRPLAGGSGLD
jgi:type VI secretion system protein ImpH